jgi:hypothetical protein
VNPARFAPLVIPLALAGCGRPDAPAADMPAPAPTTQRAAAPPTTTIVPFDDAKPIVAALGDRLPTDLRGRTADDLQAGWSGWVVRRGAEIRSRLDRGDEDSIVNFWMYGTSFTALPRVTQSEVRTLGRARTEDLLISRLDDLVGALASRGSNERLQFARVVLQRHGIDPATPEGQQQARIFLVQSRARMIAESDRYRSAAQAATGDPRSTLGVYATLYRDRGLSTDTSLSADFNLEKALEAMRAADTKSAAPLANVRRVAIVGPGLDFTDKAEGHDFYPPQSIQPFAILDSLIRLGLAKTGDLRLTTFDVSPRVNQHLRAARQRAERGEGYVLQLPIEDRGRGDRPHPDFEGYWARFGDRIGVETAPIAPPSSARRVRVRAVVVRPEIVLAIAPHDLNIVLERLAPLPADEQFDLVVATNVLVYYDAFEQALALANVAAMLRSGGFFVTNFEVHPFPPMEPTPTLTTTVRRDSQQVGDTVFRYRRR